MLLPACVARAKSGAADAEAVREYVFECGEVLDGETGMERVLAPSEHRRAVWDAEEVASAVAEPVQASAALLSASVQQQQQQQLPRDTAATQPEGASASALPGLEQADGRLRESFAAPTTTAASLHRSGSARDVPPPASLPAEESAPAAAPTPQSMPQVE